MATIFFAKWAFFALGGGIYKKTPALKGGSERKRQGFLQKNEQIYYSRCCGEGKEIPAESDRIYRIILPAPVVNAGTGVNPV